jgi:small subunit ribosomal protein S9
MATSENLQNFYGLGRRKTAVALVWLLKDTSEREVNGSPFTTYFPTEAMQKVALQPLELTSQLDQYGIRAKVFGGGKHSQSEAVKLAVARALLQVDEGFRKQLKDTGTLTRDPRMKERKKPGLKRARRAPQFSKR